MGPQLLKIQYKVKFWLMVDLFMLCKSETWGDMECRSQAISVKSGGIFIKLKTHLDQVLVWALDFLIHCEQSNKILVRILGISVDRHGTGVSTKNQTNKTELTYLTSWYLHLSKWRSHIALWQRHSSTFCPWCKSIIHPHNHLWLPTMDEQHSSKSRPYFPLEVVSHLSWPLVTIPDEK